MARRTVVSSKQKEGNEMKSKAYCFASAADYDVDDLSETVTFAETPGKAKQDFSMENGIHFKDIRV